MAEFDVNVAHEKLVETPVYQTLPQKTGNFVKDNAGVLLLLGILTGGGIMIYKRIKKKKKARKKTKKTKK